MDDSQDNVNTMSIQIEIIKKNPHGEDFFYCYQERQSVPLKYRLAVVVIVELFYDHDGKCQGEKHSVPLLFPSRLSHSEAI